MNKPVAGKLETPAAIYWENIEAEFYKKIQTINLSLYELNEDDAGKLFVDIFKDYFRYNKTSSGFMIWTGTHWTQDNWNLAERAASLIAKQIQMKMIDMAVDNLKDAAYFVKRIRSAQGIRALLFFVKADPRIVTTQNDYDNNPHLLNTPSGTFDFTIGAMQQHRRTDLITKITQVSPDPNHKPKIFLEYLDKITLGRDDLKQSLKQFIGSGCSGKYPKDKFGIFHGKGSNGKTVLLESSAYCLGDYASTIDIKYLTLDKNFTPAAGHNDDIASLAGARMCVSVESNQNSRLNEAAVKKYTGGDGIPVSFKHGHTFTMHAAFALFILTNHKPRITGHDDGMWRRAVFFPFEYKIPENEKDLDFKAKLLQADAPYIMQWLIDGCMQWYKDGYGFFETIEIATEKYKRDQDVIGRFIKDCCKVDKSFSIRAADLREGYEAWCKENDEYLFSGKAWREALEEHGMIRTQDMYGKKWKGLTI